MHSGARPLRHRGGGDAVTRGALHPPRELGRVRAADVLGEAARIALHPRSSRRQPVGDNSDWRPEFLRVHPIASGEADDGGNSQPAVWFVGNRDASGRMAWLRRRVGLRPIAVFVVAGNKCHVRFPIGV